MEVILLENVDKLGDKHDIVNVKDGYGRNFLIPQKLGLIANDTNRKRLAEFIRRSEAETLRKHDFFKEIAEKLKDVTLKIGAKAGTSGKIFGSVTNVQLATALKEQFEVDIERKKIELPEEVKNIGAYVAVLKLHPEVTAKLNFEVVQE